MHSDEASDKMRRLTLAVQSPAGQTLPAEAIARVLLGVSGVRYAFVSPHTEMAWLIYDPALFALADALDAIGDLGCRADTPEER